MGRSRAKIRVKPKKGKGSGSKIRQKVKMEPYVGDESERLRRENTNLKKQLDSINAKMMIYISDTTKVK